MATTGPTKTWTGQRAGEACVYRDRLDVLFPMHLTHTRETMQKHGGKAIALDARRVAETSSPSHAVPVLTTPLNHDMEQFAISYAYQHHIIHPGPASNTTLHVQDEKLLACLKALGMASYSMITRSSKLHDVAFRYYVTAIQAVNSALESMATALEDVTLLAIMTLSCLESISETWYRSLKGISLHVQGLCSLIGLRGVNQMKTPFGRALFMQSCSFIVSDCTRAGLPIPQTIHDLSLEFVKAMKPYDHRVVKWQTLPAFLRIANLKSAVINGHQSDPRIIIKEARDIDQIFATAYSEVPYTFEHEVHAHLSRPGSELPAYIYTYRNTLSSTAWNGSRNGRMICQGLIIDVLKRNINSYEPHANVQSEIDASLNIIRQMQMDILAGVPQYLGLTGTDPWAALDESAERPLGILQHKMPGPPMEVMVSAGVWPSSLPVLHVPRDILLLFNLAVVGRFAKSGSQIRTTVCKVLRLIGRNFGFSMAMLLATALEENRLSSSVIDYQRKADAWVVGERSEELLTGQTVPEMD